MKSRYPSLILRASYFCVALLLSSCATIINGDKQTITISAIPSDASIVVLDTEWIQSKALHYEQDTSATIEPIRINRLRGTGTFTTRLERGIPHHIVISRPGYTTVHFITGTESNGLIWGNLLFGNVIGDLIDLNSGAAYSITPENVSISLDQGVGDSYYHAYSDHGRAIAATVVTVAFDALYILLIISLINSHFTSFA